MPMSCMAAFRDGERGLCRIIGRVKRLLIVWCSTTGGARQMAEAAERGAREADGAVEVRRLPAAEAGPADVLAADALLLAMPEHLGSMAGPMKDFLDRVYYPCLDRVNGRPWGLLVCAGSDGQGTIRQAERIATGLRLKRVMAPVLAITHAQTPEAILAPKTIAEDDLDRCSRAGAVLAAGVAAGIF
jgi:multimeric flavodoxin WrbA